MSGTKNILSARRLSTVNITDILVTVLATCSLRYYDNTSTNHLPYKQITITLHQSITSITADSTIRSQSVSQ